MLFLWLLNGKFNLKFLIFYHRRVNLINSQENTRSITQTRALVEEIAQMMPAQEARMSPMIIWAARVEAKCPPKSSHLTSREGGHIITLIIREIFRSREALCIASTCITQVFRKSSTKLSSTCAACSRFPLTWNPAKVPHSCCKTAFNQACWQWWLSLRTVKSPLQWWQRRSNS